MFTDVVTLHVTQLLWVTFIGLIFALIIQSLAANLGVATGKHLAEHCKTEYPTIVKYFLWILAEIAVIAADIPEGKLFPITCKSNRSRWIAKHTHSLIFVIFWFQ